MDGKRYVFVSENGSLYWKELVLFHTAKDENYIFSNFYPHVSGQSFKSLNILYEGKYWPSSEHLYQALKFHCDTPEEKEWREIIRTASTPFMSKYLGHLDTYIKYDWHKRLQALVLKYKDKVRVIDISIPFKVSIMYVAVKAKFDSCPEFKEALMKTKGKMLMENINDEWGYKMGLLGKILEKVRDE